MGESDSPDALKLSQVVRICASLAFAIRSGSLAIGLSINLIVASTLGRIPS
jgi:hypothetical protein